MQFKLALPILALAAQVLAAPVPAVITETNVVVVTAQAEPTSSVAPKVGKVVEVIVSKLVQIRAHTTETFITTYTKQQSTPTATPATLTPAQAETTSTPTTTEVPTTEAPATTEVPTTEAPATTEVSTTEAPVTTEAAPTTEAPATTEVSTTEAVPTTTESPTTAATTEDSTATDSFSSEILAIHNKLRAEWGSGSLTWSSELADYAQAYADSYDCSGTLTHTGGPYGENLALGYSTTGAVQAWYDENSYYDASNPSASHFTQVVWKSTTQLGCGYKTCDNIWGQYTICSYNPAGNFGGQYAENV